MATHVMHRMKVLEGRLQVHMESKFNDPLLSVVTVEHGLSCIRIAAIYVLADSRRVVEIGSIYMRKAQFERMTDDGVLLKWRVQLGKIVKDILPLVRLGDLVVGK